MLTEATANGPLPLSLRQELLRLRREMDQACGQGRVRRAASRLADQIGSLLVREARRPATERGFRMVDLSLCVDRLFPELRSLHDQEVQREGRQHQQQAGVPRPGVVPPLPNLRGA